LPRREIDARHGAVMEHRPLLGLHLPRREPGLLPGTVDPLIGRRRIRVHPHLRSLRWGLTAGGPWGRGPRGRPGPAGPATRPGPHGRASGGGVNTRPARPPLIRAAWRAVDPAGWAGS